MFRELHFPTPIYIADIKHPTLNQELERDIVAWSKQDKGVVRTNVQGWHSHTNMADLPEYKKLVNKKDSIIQYYNDIYKTNLDRIKSIEKEKKIERLVFIVLLTLALLKK